MYKYRLLFLCVIFLNSISATRDTRPYPPYISGDAFRAIADYTYDELGVFDAGIISKSSIVFVKADMLDQFFHTVHPHIQHPYVLVTHNSDDGAPGRYIHYLNDEKIIHWFGQNPTIAGHSKFSPIPIGIPNRQWVDAAVYTRHFSGEHFQETNSLVYLNISTATHPERLEVYKLFSKESHVLTRSRTSLADYCKQVVLSKFVLSPRGNGLDTHRTWEALMAGAVPIVFTSPLDSIYSGLPVLIVEDWHMLTREYLESSYLQLESGTYAYEKLNFSYWEALIRSSLR